MSDDIRGKANKILQKCNEWAQKIQSNKTTLDAQQRAEMATWGQIPQLFEPFAQLPDPNGAIKTLIDDLKGALTELSDGQLLPATKANKEGETISPVGDLKHMDVSTLVDGWTGSAAQNFTTNFIKPFPANVQSQFIAVYVMRSAIQAYQSVWKTARDDANKIADKTLKALEHDCSLGGSSAMVLTVIGSVASVGTAFAGGPVVAGVLALELVAGVAQVGAQAAGQAKEEVNISGSDPLIIVPKLKQALTKLTEHIKEEQNKVYTVISKDLSALQGGRSKLIPMRPELAGATRGNVHGMMGNAN